MVCRHSRDLWRAGRWACIGRNSPRFTGAFDEPPLLRAVKSGEGRALRPAQDSLWEKVGMLAAIIPRGQWSLSFVCLLSLGATGVCAAG